MVSALGKNKHIILLTGNSLESVNIVIATSQLILPVCQNVASEESTAELRARDTFLVKFQSRIKHICLLKICGHINMHCSNQTKRHFITTDI